jgi:ribosomal protein S18 acetylase RimI-like enzyme
MHPLDNVIWQALTTRQAEFAQTCDQACRFKPEVASLAGLRRTTAQAYESLAGLATPGELIYLSLEKPYEPQPGWDFVAGGPMPQMVYEKGAANFGTPSSGASASEIIELGPADIPDMMELTELTQPGPFSKRTHELGTYLGIRCEGKLVAMAGQRMKVPGYTEVSAVCTHPDHLGQGYARILMAEIMRRIFDCGEIPFLHVREENQRAISLYEKLGFRRRVTSQLTVIRKRLQ